MEKNFELVEWQDKLDLVRDRKDVENNRRELIILGRDIGDGPKRYTVVTYNRFFQLFKKIMDKPKFYNEMLDNELPIKLFLDIDGKEKMKIDIVRGFVIDLVIPALTKMLSLEDPKILFLDSSKESKVSFHLIFYEIIIENKYILNQIMNDLIYDLGNGLIQKSEYKDHINLIETIDPSIKSLRTYHSVKYSEKNRKLVEYDVKNKKHLLEYDEEILKKSLLHFISKDIKILSYERKHLQNQIIPRRNYGVISMKSTQIEDSSMIDSIIAVIDMFYLINNIQEKVIYDKKNGFRKLEDGVKVQLGNKCFVSKLKRGGIAHTKTKADKIFFIISFKYKNCVPHCFHASCKNDETFKFILAKFMCKMNDDLRLNLMKKMPSFDVPFIKFNEKRSENTKSKKDFNFFDSINFGKTGELPKPKKELKRRTEEKKDTNNRDKKKQLSKFIESEAFDEDFNGIGEEENTELTEEEIKEFIDDRQFDDDINIYRQNKKNDKNHKFYDDNDEIKLDKVEEKETCYNATDLYYLDTEEEWKIKEEMELNEKIELDEEEDYVFESDFKYSPTEEELKKREDKKNKIIEKFGIIKLNK